MTYKQELDYFWCQRLPEILTYQCISSNFRNAIFKTFLGGLSPNPYTISLAHRLFTPLELARPYPAPHSPLLKFLGPPLNISTMCTMHDCGVNETTASAISLFLFLQMPSLSSLVVGLLSLAMVPQLSTSTNLCIAVCNANAQQCMTGCFDEESCYNDCTIPAEKCRDNCDVVADNAIEHLQPGVRGSVRKSPAESFRAWLTRQEKLKEKNIVDMAKKSQKIKKFTSLLHDKLLNDIP